MRKRTLLYIGLAGAVLFWLNYAAQKIAASFNVVGVGFRFGSLDLSGLDFTVPVKIQNNTALTLAINAFRGRLVYGKIDLAPVLVNSPIILEANKTTTINVQSRISFFDLAADIIDRLTNKQALNELRLIGTFDFKGIPVPLDYPISFT